MRLLVDLPTALHNEGKALRHLKVDHLLSPLITLPSPFPITLRSGIHTSIASVLPLGALSQ